MSARQRFEQRSRPKSFRRPKSMSLTIKISIPCKLAVQFSTSSIRNLNAPRGPPLTQTPSCVPSPTWM